MTVMSNKGRLQTLARGCPPRWQIACPTRAIECLRAALAYITSRDKVWLATGSELIDAFKAQEL